MMTDESTEGQSTDPTKRDRALRAVLSIVKPTVAVSASEFMRAAWAHYERYREELATREGKRVQDYGSLNGSVFQALVEQALLAHNIQPIYCQAQMAFIAVAVYDIIVYTEERGPVNLSLKTTIRERWKQADLEGAALKNVHKRAKVYVVNNSPDETAVRSAEIHNCIGIDAFVVCTTPEFDRLVEQLREWKPTVAPTAPLVRHATAVLEGN
jgi:hypothetical protein